MEIRIYNSLTNQIESFKPINEGKVSMYVCGPTVYNFVHIGNMRPVVVFDTFRLFLTYIGYDVKYVSNYTDVDDKIINKANEEGTDYMTISERYIAEYKTDAQGLGVKEATIHPRATENIDEIISIVSDFRLNMTLFVPGIGVTKASSKIVVSSKRSK